MLDAAACIIRPMVSHDLASVLYWRNHPEVRRYMLTQHEISAEEHQCWFEHASQDNSRRLLIVEQNQRALGFVHFSQVSPGGISDWGFYAVPGTPRGSGKKLGNTALNYAFCDLGLHKICGQAVGFNEASIGFHRALGFSQEGVLRDQYRVEDEYQDLICFGLLRHEWVKFSSN